MAHQLSTIAARKLMEQQASLYQEASILSEDAESLATTLLFSLGGHCDARNMTAAAKRFFSAELFELYRLAGTDRKAMAAGGIQKIRWQLDIDRAEPIIRQLYHVPEDNTFLFFGSEEARMQAQQMAGEQMDPVFQQVYADMTSLLDSSVTNGNAMEAKLNVFRVVIFIVILLIIGVGFAGSEKAGKRIAKGIAGPLKALADRLDGFAAGDLSSEFPEVKTDDEVAEMNRAAIAMAENLRMIIEDIKQALNAMANGDWTVKFLYPDLYAGDLDELKEALRDIKYKMNEALYNVNSVSDQVSMGAGSLADAAQSLAEGATEQAGAVQQLQATITNITSMVDNTAEHTKNSSRQAQEYSAKADEGRTEMNHLMEIMGRINETSEKISNIIGEIEDIASQTNLLSLNASIEAARAGEAGRGFAVVADQIGKLAEQSAQSAVNTRELIGGTLEEIHAGNEAVDHASQTLSTIVDGVRKIAQDSEELTQIADTQADAMNQAESGVNQISEIVQSNSAAAEELSATSEELLAQSENMTNLVKQFKLIDEEKIQARKKEADNAGI